MIYTRVFRFGAMGTAAQLAILPAIASFLSLFFTGSSTFTSLSGVKKEMRIAVPVLSFLILAGIVISFIS